MSIEYWKKIDAVPYSVVRFCNHSAALCELYVVYECLPLIGLEASWWRVIVYTLAVNTFIKHILPPSRPCCCKETTDEQPEDVQTEEPAGAG